MRLKSIVAMGFPGYKGRRFYLREFRSPQNTSSYWSGGSINYYQIVNLATGETHSPPSGQYPWCQSKDRGQIWLLTDDECLLWESVVRGKPFSVTVYCTLACKEKYSILNEKGEEDWTK